ncbi:MAG: hypothetical protein H0T46_23235 [Deltaproteobacteria bacterium]|nr:hypothetical protein [Deltaproteobacteria bacterium]
MSARTLRRSFAAPFVVTIAGCMVQSGPPPQRGPRPQPQPVTSTQPQDMGVVANPPHPGAQVEPKPTHEMHWTVTKEGETCRAYAAINCPANAACRPAPPTDYACTPQVAHNAPMKVVRWNGSETCQIETEPMRCPPNVMCNPPPPQQVACPK